MGQLLPLWAIFERFGQLLTLLTSGHNLPARASALHPDLCLRRKPPRQHLTPGPLPPPSRLQLKKKALKQCSHSFDCLTIKSNKTAFCKVMNSGQMFPGVSQLSAAELR